jgi:D-alanyl-lipoteichoic acid acyltransferase DltB (MBOAT superfamily)
MLLAGLWHGANWTFVVFGAIHGVGLCVERLLSPSKAEFAGPASPSDRSGFFAVWARRILTFNVFCLSMVFFRAPSIRSAVHFLGGLFHFGWQSQYLAALLMVCIFSIPLFLMDLFLEASNYEYPLAEAPYVVRIGLALTALVVLALFSGTKFSTFIYFQF